MSDLTTNQEEEAIYLKYIGTYAMRYLAYMRGTIDDMGAGSRTAAEAKCIITTAFDRVIADAREEERERTRVLLDITRRWGQSIVDGLASGRLPGIHLDDTRRVEEIAAAIRAQSPAPPPAACSTCEALMTALTTIVSCSGRNGRATASRMWTIAQTALASYRAGTRTETT